MKKCQQCGRVLGQGHVRYDTEGMYVLRICSCGRLHKTRFPKPKQEPPVSNPVGRVIEFRTWGYLIYVSSIGV
jgi:hypothetical protein